MQRPTGSTMDNVANAGTLTSTITYQLASRKVITTHPGGSVTTTTLESLGKIASREPGDRHGALDEQLGRRCDTQLDTLLLELPIGR